MCLLCCFCKNKLEIFKVKAGDRIAQLICEKIALPAVEEVFKLDDTIRGCTGFGDSGR